MLANYYCHTGCNSMPASHPTTNTDSPNQETQFSIRLNLTTVPLFIWLYWLYWLYFVQFQKVMHENNPLSLCLSVFFLLWSVEKLHMREERKTDSHEWKQRDNIYNFSLIHTIRMVDALSTILILWIITEDDEGNGCPSNRPFSPLSWVNPLLHTW